MDKQRTKTQNRLGQQAKLSGLDLLFGQNDGMLHISLDSIRPAEWQPRKAFDVTGLAELAESIKRYGVLQPILLKKSDCGYEIIAGERRFRASKLAGMDSVPALIMSFDVQQALEISMIENLQRRDLNPIEKSEGFAFLIEKLNVSQEELAMRLGLNRSVITNYLRINTLSDDIKDKIALGKISVGHAKMLVNKAGASELAIQIVEKKLSVRDIEKKVQQLENKQSKKKINKKTDSEEIKRFEEMIAQQLDTSVTIEMQKNSGKVILEFNDLIKLDEIISAICQI